MKTKKGYHFETVSGFFIFAPNDFSEGLCKCLSSTKIGLLCLKFPCPTKMLPGPTLRTNFE